MTINPLIKLAVILCLVLQSCEHNKSKKTTTPQPKIDGMVWIPGGLYEMGASDEDRMAFQHEKPKHFVQVDGFYMDITVNRQQKVY
jgi:formylglycine-generating enzyme